MKKKLIAAVAGSLLAAGAATAVELAPYGKGDLLIAPVYMTGGGWATELKVINTSATESAVAKVVVHSPTDSAELRDFFIFLSPGDVWVGSVTEAAGAVTISSTDDSGITLSQLAGSNCTPSSGTVGINASLGGFTIGYINIFEAKVLRGLPMTAAGTVDKASIVARYAADCVAGVPLTADTTANILTGSVKLANPLNGNMLMIPMTALANYENTNYLNQVLYTGFAANIANSNKGQVEDSIWQSNFVLPYNNAAGQWTFATVTFPTKEAFYRTTAASQYSPFPGPVGVGYTVRDEQENTFAPVGCTYSPCPLGTTFSLPNELNIISIVGAAGTSTATVVDTKTFNKGWVNMSLTSEASTVRANTAWNNFGMTGAPALVTYIQWNQVGSMLQGAWNYAPSTYEPGPY